MGAPRQKGKVVAQLGVSARHEKGCGQERVIMSQQGWQPEPAEAGCVCERRARGCDSSEAARVRHWVEPVQAEEQSVSERSVAEYGPAKAVGRHRGGAMAVVVRVFA